MRYKKIYLKYNNLSYNDFINFANNPKLSKYEKIGFPDNFRANFEANIYKDIFGKIPELRKSRQYILDIGSGCSNLPVTIIKNAAKVKSRVYLVDSKEMLDLLPEFRNATKIYGEFPYIKEFISKNKNKFNIIISYSVLQCVFSDKNIFKFIDAALSLLKKGGTFLIGDIPNSDKRKRLLMSDSGVKFHKIYMNTDKAPTVEFNILEQDVIDDNIIFAILGKYRKAGYETYLVEQNPSLPFANRREDIIIKKRN